jgi:hypothetical protein
LERLVLAIGTKELGSAIGHPALELGAGEALVGDDGEAGERDPLEHLARDLSQQMRPGRRVASVEQALRAGQFLWRLARPAKEITSPS